MIEGQAGQWPRGCRGWCALALVLWRGWLYRRWRGQGKPQKWWLYSEGDQAEEGSLGTEAKQTHCWVLLSHRIIFT